MKKLFFDTNILLDILADRRPYSFSAAKLLDLSLSGQVTIYASAISFNNIYYILKRSLSHNEALKLLTGLTELVEVVDVTKEIIQQSIISGFKDFEDAIQYYSAKTIDNIDVLVTRNIRDYKKSDIPVRSAEEVLALISEAF
ncbi:MAG: type II toxin-antitoxin system VapC family toxin [Flavisolibacter sp.]